MCRMASGLASGAQLLSMMSRLRNGSPDVGVAYRGPCAAGRVRLSGLRKLALQVTVGGALAGLVTAPAGAQWWQIAAGTPRCGPAGGFTRRESKRRQAGGAAVRQRLHRCRLPQGFSGAQQGSRSVLAREFPVRALHHQPRERGRACGLSGRRARRHRQDRSQAAREAGGAQAAVWRTRRHCKSSAGEACGKAAGRPAGHNCNAGCRRACSRTRAAGAASGATEAPVGHLRLIRRQGGHIARPPNGLRSQHCGRAQNHFR